MAASIAAFERPRLGPSNTVFKSGPLFISSKGLGWKSWKKRWFILTRTSLVFFKNDPSALPQRGGEVNLTLGGIDLNNSGSVVVREDKKLLTVLFPDGRDGRAFTLKAETSEDLYEWKTALEQALAQAPSAALVMGHNGIFRNDTSDAIDGSFNQWRDKRPVKSLVVGRPILLALEDIDGGPSFLEKALRFLETYGNKVEGILRQSADVEEVERRVQDYEQGNNEFDPNEDAHVVGDCVKHVLRELPSSPVPASCCTALLEAYRETECILKTLENLLKFWKILVYGITMQRVCKVMLLTLLLLNILPLFVNNRGDGGRFGYGFVYGEAIQILSKSKLEKCEKTPPTEANGSNDNGNLNCTRKIIINMAVPSNSSGGEASMVAEVAEVEENSTNKMQTLRLPPVITVNKSAAYAVFDLTYIRDVPYKPQEYYVKTRKCEPDADAHVVKICERLKDDQGHVIEASQPVCCPCGDRRRVPSSCGNFFDKLVKGKANTAHCLRFPGDWFHVFGIGQRIIGFSVRIEVKTGSKVSEVIVGPDNRTALSSDSFLRVNLVGDFGGYTNIPSFEEFYLVIPRVHGPGQPPDLGRNFSMYMLLERVRFTLDGLECNKIGVSYEAFNGQPAFCTSPYWSCLHNQLWNFYEADQNRIARHQPPLYGVVGRFERINEHPGAGPRTFSFGISEAINTNLVIELAADDIEYVYQRSPGKILGVTVPTFEALAQYGTADINTKNTGKVEASYSLTFKCSKGVTMMEEQFFIMKPEEVGNRSFKIYLTSDQASKYACSAILKDSEFNEVDRAECQFTTTATVLDNGTQGAPFQPPKSETASLFGIIKDLWNKFWAGLLDFITGKNCRSKCSGFFDFHCHIQYVCMSWVIMFGLFLSIFPTALVLLWLLHQKGLFDPLYDWWEDHCWEGTPRHKKIPRHRIQHDHHRIHHKRHRPHHHRAHHHHNVHEVKHRHRKNNNEQDHHHAAHRSSDYNQYLHHVHKDKHRHGKHRSSTGAIQHLDNQGDLIRHHRHRKGRRANKRTSDFQIYDKEDIHEPYENEPSFL